MGEKTGKTGIVAGVLLPMGLICLFAFCSLALALLGGQAYKQIQGGIDDAYGSTVAANYLRTKLAQHNAQDAVYLQDMDGYDVLVIENEKAGSSYETRIYVVEGELRETHVPAETPFSPASGIGIAAVTRCSFSISEDGLFEAEIESKDGQNTRAVFALAGGGSL